MAFYGSNLRHQLIFLTSPPKNGFRTGTWKLIASETASGKVVISTFYANKGCQSTVGCVSVEMNTSDLANIACMFFFDMLQSWEYWHHWTTTVSELLRFLNLCVDTCGGISIGWSDVSSTKDSKSYARFYWVNSDNLNFWHFLSDIFCPRKNCPAIPINMPECASTESELKRCKQHRFNSDSVQAHSGMFTGIWYLFGQMGCYSDV